MTEVAKITPASGVTSVTGLQSGDNLIIARSGETRAVPYESAGVAFSYATRAAFVTAVAAGLSAEDGTIVAAGSLLYEASTGATDISDLSGFIPSGDVYPDHFATNTTPGTTDMLAAFNAAIDFLADGGNLRLMPVKYGVSDTVHVDTSGIYIVGSTPGFYRPAPSATNIVASASSIIQPTAALSSGSPVVDFQTPASGFRCVGGGMRDVMVNGNGTADICLRVKSWARGDFRGLSLVYAKLANLDLDVVTTATLAANAVYDTQFNKFSDIYTDNINFPACDGAYGLRTRGFENVGGVNPDPVPATIGNPNVSFNVFENCNFSSNTQHATWLETATDNIFIHCGATVRNDTTGATYKGWVLTAVEQDSRLTASVTKRNTFHKCQGWIWARAGQSGGKSSEYNRFYDHKTSVVYAFDHPVEYEAPAGGSRDADILISTDFGEFGSTRLVGSYSDINAKRQFVQTKAVTYDVTLSGSVTSVTISGAFPAGSTFVGVTTAVTTALTGVSGYGVGDGTDADRWGLKVATAVGTTTGSADYTDGTIEAFTSATDVVLTRNTGAFTGGVIRVTVFYQEALSEYA